MPLEFPEGRQAQAPTFTGIEIDSFTVGMINQTQAHEVGHVHTPRIEIVLHFVGDLPEPHQRPGWRRPLVPDPDFEGDGPAPQVEDMSVDPPMVQAPKPVVHREVHVLHKAEEVGPVMMGAPVGDSVYAVNYHALYTALEGRHSDFFGGPLPALNP